MEKNLNDMNCPIEIIAEIANAHQGDPAQALALAKAAAKAGCNAVKYQIYRAEEMLVPEHKRYNHFKKQSFSAAIWHELLRESQSLGVKIYADVFGVESFKIALEHNMDGYKVHASDICNTKLLRALDSVKEKVFISTGGCTINEIC